MDEHHQNDQNNRNEPVLPHCVKKQTKRLVPSVPPTESKDVDQLTRSVSGHRALGSTGSLAGGSRDPSLYGSRGSLPHVGYHGNVYDRHGNPKNREVDSMDSSNDSKENSPQDGATVVGSNQNVEIQGPQHESQAQQELNKMTMKEKFKKYFFIILAGVSCIIGNMFVGSGAVLLAVFALHSKNRKIALALNLLSVFVSICAYIVTAALIIVMDKFLF